MENEGSEFLLKILSGNHQGAEIVFGYETAVIGSANTSDVVLSDSLIEPKHLEVTFSADGISLKPINSKVFVDGKLVKEDVVKIEEFQFITLGATHIIIGPANKTWPAISAADAPALSETDQDDTQNNLTFDDPTPPETTKKIKPVKRSKAVIYGASTLVILATAVALLIFMSIFSEPEVVPVKPDTMQLLEGAIREFGFGGEISIARLENGGFSVTGYTATNDDMVALKNKLTSIDPTIRQKIYSEEKVLSEISNLLANIDSRPKVQVLGNGTFLMTGYAFDKDKWNKTRKRILEDVRGIVDLQDEVILPQKITNLIRPILSKYKLLGKIGIIPRVQDVVIQGLVSADEEENWKLAKLQIEKTLGKDVAITNLVRISDPEVIRQQYFGSEVNSVSIGPNGMNWISFKDGTKYTEGATLSNGYSIKEITPENIVLTKGNQTIILKIGELQ